MSVVLGACRHSKQRAIAKALKKKAEKQKMKREAAQQYQQYEEQNLAEFAVFWHLQIDADIYDVVFVLPSDSPIAEIFVNENQVGDAQVTCEGDEPRYTFKVNGIHDAVIKCTKSASGFVFNLFVNQFFVPQVE